MPHPSSCHPKAGWVPWGRAKVGGGGAWKGEGAPKLGGWDPNRGGGSKPGRWGALLLGVSPCPPTAPDVPPSLCPSVLQVAVNGQHTLEFLHRLPLASVQALEVTGDVTLTCITFTGPVSTPRHPPPGLSWGHPWVPGVTQGPPPLPPPHPLSSPHRVGGGCRTGAPGRRFHANLWSSASGDLVLHINPRLREAALVRNTRQHGSWGPEERHTTGPMPFQRGQPFQLEIRPLSQAFALWVNGRHVCDYSHRLPPATIDQLEVAGDVTLACVTC
uniref:Galectin n=1 Tax=Aquila chrysaetos chrysaetos TaxID=223781 RepID=A0A663FJ27_AQUCH